MGLLNYKTLFVLLFVVFLNAGISVLLWQLDVFVHHNLYDYGLIFSYDWAERVWHNNLSCWVFVIGASALTVVAMVPHYFKSRELEPSRLLGLSGFLLSVLALIFEGIGIFFLNQLDFAIRNSLYDFGISSSFDWSITFEPLIGAAYFLMAVSMLALIIPTVRSLGIVEIEVTDEDE